MTALSFDDGFEVKIEGKGKARAALEEYYQKYTIDESIEEPSFTCTVRQLTPEPEIAFGDPNLYYGKESDQFVVKNTSSVLKLSKNWDEVVCSPDSSKNAVAYLLEYEMRKQYSKLGRTLIHGSGVDINGSTLIFPAWRHTGKTNLMLTLLQKHGGNYLSDDRVWIHNDGKVTGYDLPVNMMPYNIKSFSNIGSFSVNERLAAKASNSARSISYRLDGLISKAASFMNIFYFEPMAAKRIMVNDILPEAEFQPRADVDAVILLHTAPNDETVKLQKVSRKAVRQSIIAASHYEWNKELEEFCRVFDSLFQDMDTLSEHHRLMESEDDIIESFLEDIPVFKLMIPREEHWNEKGIGDQTSECIQEVLNTI